jgi:Flp pilus assembly pilin Flp
MSPLNPLAHPLVRHLLVLARARLDRARRRDASLGASAIELAIITAVLAAIAITIGTIVFNKIKTSANNINTDVPTFSP